MTGARQWTTNRAIGRCLLLFGWLLLAADTIAFAQSASLIFKDQSTLAELLPTGKLRVAIAVGPAPSAIYALKDEAPNNYRGVTIDLSRRLAEQLGVELVFVPYAGSGEIQAAANSGVWDVSYMPVDEARKAFVDFGNAYHVLQSTYLVGAGSSIQSVAMANKPGIRIVGVTDTATFRASNRASPLASHIAVASVDAAIERMRLGEADAIALGRESLGGVATKLLGSRVLADAFLNSTTAIAVPKNRPKALALISKFIEAEKQNGNVRKAFDAIGLTQSQVAPIGFKP